MAVIVVASDGSGAATAALAAAIDLAAATGDRIAVITVWRALQHDFGVAYPSSAVLDDLLLQERTHAESTLEDALARGHEAGIEIETRLATGDPADCICAYADELDARLVAMGTHGYGAVAALLLGSVSADVIRRWRRPVLVVPEPVSADGHEAAAAPATSRRGRAGPAPPSSLLRH
jgi:nucleotide-binding universal stress UspA family protein